MRGVPSSDVRTPPEPKQLFLPLTTRRFRFSSIEVGEGDDVAPGLVLARAPEHHNLSLLAPRGGRVSLSACADHITIEIGKEQRHEQGPARNDSGDQDPVSVRHALIENGSWQWLANAVSGALPSPDVEPKAVIVNAVGADPFTPHPSVALAQSQEWLSRGISAIASAAQECPVYLAVPRNGSPVEDTIRRAWGGYAAPTTVAVPSRYPLDSPTLLCKALKLTDTEQDIVWHVDIAGLVAIGRAVTTGSDGGSRLITVAGPGVEAPSHVRVPPGYPIEEVLRYCKVQEHVRVVVGGPFSGRELTESHQGLDSECTSLTVVPEPAKREVLAFANPGLSRISYSRSFLSALLPWVKEKATTAMRGERRPCVSCNFCEEVCPAGILPFQIHRYASKDLLEEAYRLQVEDCIGCGLCSYVCPSKIDLAAELDTTKNRIRRELFSSEEEE